MKTLQQLSIVVVVVMAQVALAGPNPYLAQAKVLHQGLEFEKCIKRLETAQNWKSTSEQEFAEIELYQGLCQLGLGKEKDATGHFEMALKIDASIALPPLQSPKVTKLFAAVRQRIGVPEPSKVEPAKVEPAKVEPEKIEPAKVEPAKVEPAKVEPAKVEPAKIEPAKVEPAKDAPKQVELTPPTGPAPGPSVASGPHAAKIIVPSILGALAIGAGVAFAILYPAAQESARQQRESVFQTDALRLMKKANDEIVGANIALYGGVGLLVAAIASAVLIQ